MNKVCSTNHISLKQPEGHLIQSKVILLSLKWSLSLLLSKDIKQSPRGTEMSSESMSETKPLPPRENSPITMRDIKISCGKRG